jgi:hypothetical protein
MVYLPMSYLYGLRATGKLTDLVISLRSAFAALHYRKEVTAANLVLGPSCLLLYV